MTRLQDRLGSRGRGQGVAYWSPPHVPAALAAGFHTVPAAPAVPVGRRYAGGMNTLRRGAALAMAVPLMLAGCTSTAPSSEASPTPTERRTMSRAEFQNAIDDALSGVPRTGDPDYDALARTVCDKYEEYRDKGLGADEAFNEMIARVAAGGPLAENMGLRKLIELHAWSILYECPELADGEDLTD